ncbi:uncharacterized protein EV154DRAFT_555196 [Mucor mucedo]|uniref:uncharacterized protein n=1 Tax=Mucor mucedo TaxID=29922 RepID=UPI00221E603B|nr:uncharacterized protein EV154DRAFT_555196 [Mucor mucedo]KAI7881531.1 hypothetical protein EV154DRAFT_555196 [Mucor mucedo]
MFANYKLSIWPKPEQCNFTQTQLNSEDLTKLRANGYQRCNSKYLNGHLNIFEVEAKKINDEEKRFNLYQYKHNANIKLHMEAANIMAECNSDLLHNYNNYTLYATHSSHNPDINLSNWRSRYTKHPIRFNKICYQWYGKIQTHQASSYNEDMFSSNGAFIQSATNHK